MKKLLAAALLTLLAAWRRRASRPQPAPGRRRAGAPSRASRTSTSAWSHYTGWEPWGYADNAGILKKWGDKYGIDIKLTLVNDYVESINLYTSGKFQACLMTNMDALTIPGGGRHRQPGRGRGRLLQRQRRAS
jgi:ABC-type nitrate/sulfonate/bicarbonate transport system substrate-binding protein